MLGWWAKHLCLQPYQMLNYLQMLPSLRYLTKTGNRSVPQFWEYLLQRLLINEKTFKIAMCDVVYYDCNKFMRMHVECNELLRNKLRLKSKSYRHNSDTVNILWKPVAIRNRFVALDILIKRRKKVGKNNEQDLLWKFRKLWRHWSMPMWTGGRFWECMK